MTRIDEVDRIACLSPLGPFEDFLRRGAIGMSDDPTFNTVSLFSLFHFPSQSRLTSLLDYGRSSADYISTNFNA